MRPVVDGVVRIPRRVSRARSGSRAGQAPGVGATLADGLAYRVERRWGMGEERFVVVAPSGACLFWFADLASAEAEVQSLRHAQPREATNAPTGGVDDGEHRKRTSRIPLG